MNYVDFNKMLLPLTEKEQLYKDHPELSDGFYKCADFKRTSDGILRFGSLARNENISHGMIGTHIIHHRHNITLCKQTRFSKVPLHTHDYVEMNFVFSGHCDAVINGEEISLSRGEISILDSQVTHTILPTGEDDIVLNILMTKSYFHNGFITRLSNDDIIGEFIMGVINEQEQHNQYLLFHTKEETYLHHLITHLFCEYLDARLCSDVTIDCYMQLIFVELTRFWQTQHECEYRKFSKNYITEILHFIEDNYNTHSLKEIALHFGFHPNSLSRKIRKETGQTFEQIITHYRLRSASFQLKKSTQPISQIAAQCGYNNQKSFYKKFSALYGCTPGEYRKHTEKDI